MLKKKQFFQAKFDYYRTFNMWVIIAACIASLTYFFSDCYIFGYFTMTTFVSRFCTIIPLTIFLVLNQFIRSYRVMSLVSLLVGHSIMWSTIWACTKLPNLMYASDGFIIINFVFLAIGISLPLRYGIIGHALIFLDIVIANNFVHYPEYAMMFLLGVPAYLGICVLDIAIEATFKDQYISRRKIESDLVRDHLTGIYNRKIFQTIASSRNELFDYPKNQISVLMFDIDHFKEVNDSFGHDAGDKVLKHIVRMVSSEIRGYDYLIRWGGEEFVLLLSNCSLETAYEKAEAIRIKIQIMPCEVTPVTISIGVAQYEGGDYHAAIQHADDAMYRAKQSGRNMVVKYEK